MATIRLITVLLCIVCVSSFRPPSSIPSRWSKQSPHTAQLMHHVKKNINQNASDEAEITPPSPSVSRRQLFQLATNGAVATSLMIGMPGASLAAVPASSELKRLQVGHSRVQYLLKNWDKLTQTCDNKAMSATESKQVVRTEGGGGGFCDKNPLIVQEYLGYKSTKDPLFKADSLMLKAVPLVDESVVDEADYVDLVEQYRDKADQTALLAYTSSWGEANPNGGKEAVDDYLDKTKEVVVETEVLLRKILKALQLDVLEPSQKA